MLEQDTQSFLSKFPEILSWMHQNEISFDPLGIHGRPHIIRTVLMGSAFIEYYYQVENVDLPVFPILSAIAFHDLGKKDNGPDLWEQDSARLHQEFLQQQGYGITDADRWSDMICDNRGESIAEQIVHDADALDILRLISRIEFDLGKLYFINKAPQNHLNSRIYLIQSLIPIAIKCIDDQIETASTGTFDSTEYLESCMTRFEELSLS